MKKLIKTSALLLTLCISLCACNKSDNLPEPPSSVADISNPFEEISPGGESVTQSTNGTDATNPSGSSNDSDYDEEEEIEKNRNRFNEAASQIRALGTDFYISKAEWVDSETLKIPLKLEGRGKPETKFCPLILCDGQLVQTSMDGKNFGYSECRINFAEETDDPENITHEIYIKPVFDSGLTNHYIALGYIANPDERPDDYWMVSGILVQSHAIWSTKLNISEDTRLDIDGRESIYAEAGNILEAESAVPLTDEQKQKYEMTNEESPRTRLDIEDPADSQTFSQDGKHQYNIILAENSNKAKFSVVAASTQPQRVPYRVAFFVNYKPVKINDEYDYLAFTLEGGKISTTEVEIDGLKDKDVVCAVFCPMPEVHTGHTDFKITDVHLVEEDK